MKEGLLNALAQIKILAVQTGTTTKEAVVFAASDVKVGATVAAGTTASGLWTSKDVVTWVGVALSVCLIIKYIVDIKKSMLEMEIMKHKEEERINAILKDQECSDRNYHQ